MYALAGTEILVEHDKEVQMAVNEFGSGRAVYISGLPYSFSNSRVLHRAILWSSHGEGGAQDLVQLQLQRRSPRLPEERQVLRREQHLRAPVHHRLPRRRQLLRAGPGRQRDTLVRTVSIIPAARALSGPLFTKWRTYYGEFTGGERGHRLSRRLCARKGAHSRL